MQLNKIKTIQAHLVCLTGLHIGAGAEEMHIGGVDNTVVKNPVTGAPYIPGSSLKGKMRSLMEWRSGEVKSGPLDWSDWENTANAKVLTILQLFGLSGSANLDPEEAAKLGPTRLSFWDCPLNDEWSKSIDKRGLSPFEVKSENTINRITCEAQPRFMERVVPNAPFDFKLTVKCLDGDDNRFVKEALKAMKLLELDGLGGSTSRGYGKVQFRNVCIDGQDISAEFEKINPFVD